MNDEESAKWDAVDEGVELLRGGEHKDAIALLLDVAAAHPTNEYAHFFLGHAYFETEDFERALKCYVRALELKPQYLGAMVGAGHALRLIGDHERALRMGRQALRQEKDDPDALYLMGLVHFTRGDKSEAEGFLTRFLETNPEAEIALEVEGMLQMLRGDVSVTPEVEA